MTLLNLGRRSLIKSAGLAAVAGVTASSGFVQPVFAQTATQTTAGTAASPFPSRPVANRFMVGAFEVTTIFDGAVQLDGPHPIFGANVDAAEVMKLAEENFLPGSKMEIGFTPTVIRNGGNTILFDSGNGDSTGRRPNAGNLVQNMALIGIKAEDVTHVLLTHFHPDHIGGLVEGGKTTFPNAVYVANAAEYDFWIADERLSGPTERVGKLVQSNVKPFAEKFTFIKPGDSVVSGLTAIDASGHTPGHTAYHIEDGGERVLLIGDACNHYVVSLQRPDWHVRFDMDKEKAVQTRKSLLGMIAADKIPFIGYHMPFPSVGYVAPKGDSFKYEPASYQLYL